MKRTLLLLATLLISLQAIAGAPEQWLMNYYKSPNPQDFVSEVEKLSQSGLLKAEKLQEISIVFLSRILAANPQNITRWMRSLGKNLDKKDMKVLTYAVWLSNTSQAKAYLKSIGATAALETAPPDYLTIDIQNASTLDALWSYFFATGDAAPVRRIVSALNYADYIGSLKAYKTSKKTEQDKRNALYEAIFESARWSLQSNATNQPRVLEICETLIKDPTLSANEKLWLGTILSTIKPEKYKVIRESEHS